MMSDEERDEEIYVRHPPSYRSKSLNCFISKLDCRLDSDIANKSKHPRLDRRLGSPHDESVPVGCKRWVVKKDLSINDDRETTEEAGEVHENESGDSSDFLKF